MKILITGGAGFIGSQLIKKLRSSNEVYSYDLVDGNDIRNKIRLEDAFISFRPDVVIHCAALAGVLLSEEYPEEYISTNITGTYNVTMLCKKYNAKLIAFSSSSVLGGCRKEDEPLEEHDIYNPLSLYANTKVSGEFIVMNNLEDYAIIRPFTVYGENGRPDMVFYKWINQIKKGEAITFYGKGDSKRGYVYLPDLVDGINEIIKRKETGIFDFGGSEIVTLKDLLEIFKNRCRKISVKLEIDYQERKNGDVKHSFTNSLRAKELLNYNPKKRFKKVMDKILKKELK